MPPKVTHTREKIVAAAIAVIREFGPENLNARTIAEKLGCSTQPVMYHFKTIEELKKSAYQAADEYHTDCLMRISTDNMMMDIGMNYIRFAYEEKNLFRFLFQSNGLGNHNLSEMIEADGLKPVIKALTKAADVNDEQVRIIFRSLFLVVHGYASMLANNEMEYNEATVKEDLKFTFYGAIAASKQKEK